MPSPWLPRLVLLAVLLCAAPLHAQEAQRTHAITVDDYFTQADIFEIALSPKLGHVAYTEGRWQESTDDRKPELWVVPFGGGAARRLTSDRAGARSPLWDADGKTIYFLANRKREGEKQPPYDGKAQVWRVNVDGGSPEAVTRVEGGVEAFALGTDGKSLLYLVHRERVQDDLAGLRSKFRSLDYGHGINRLGQIWKLDVRSFRAEKLIDDGRNIRDFTVSRDGQRVAMITTPDEKVVSFEGQSRVDVFDAATGKIATVPDAVFRKQAPSPYGWLEHIAWAPDGKALAFNVIFDGYPAEIIIARWNNGSEPAVFKLPRPAGLHVKGYGSPVQWQAAGHDLCFLGEEKGRVRLCCARDVKDDAAPKLDVLTPGDVVVENFSLSAEPGRTDAFASVIATPTHLADVFVTDGKRRQRVTQVNPQAEKWKLPRLSVVTWKGANGDPVEGILEMPPDHQPGQKVPLVVEIHGGPTTAMYFKQQFWIYGRTLLPARGYAVLCPNYRGSTGYGDKFLTDLIGRENDLDVKDILAGVDALVERGIADPDRLAVSGWSNGGFLTNCIITKTTRFKAAISGAGIIDAVMEWGSNDEPAYSMAFKRGLPWNAAEHYHKASAVYQLDKVRTPTLIHVGGNDERCPPGHSRTLYRALKEYVHVPTELIVYPGEPHGLMKYRHRRAKMEWDLAWLERYVLGKK